MDLHGVIARTEALGVELEHEIAAEARKVWAALKAELEKLRPHAHPGTGVIAVDADGNVVPPAPPTPTAAESDASFAQAAASPPVQEPVAATADSAAATDQA